MANSIIDVFTAIQNGVTALNNFGKQLNGSLLNISGQLANRVISIAGNHGAFTLNAATGITNTVNDIELIQGSSSQFGAVKVDGTTIRATAGVISAVATTAPAMVLLNTVTASSSPTLNDITSFSSIYSVYEIIFENIIPTTASQQFSLQVHSGGTFQATGYLGTASAVAGAGVLGSAAATTLVQIGNTNQTNTVPGLSGHIRVHTPTGIAGPKMWVGECGFNTAASGNSYQFVASYWNANGAVDGFQVLYGSGNITSGVVKIYGIL